MSFCILIHLLESLKGVLSPCLTCDACMTSECCSWRTTLALTQGYLLGGLTWKCGGGDKATLQTATALCVFFRKIAMIVTILSISIMFKLV
jgi:hypothetical protein